MEFSEQEPAEETTKQNEDKTAEAASIPEPVDEDAIRKGLIYPPPPAFYQNFQPSPAQPTLPPMPAHPMPAPANFAPPQTQGYTQEQRTMQGPPVPPGFYPQGQPVYPPQFVPPFERQPRVRKSRRWLWITLSILGAVLLVSCGLCSWAAYSFLAPAVQGVSGSLNTVDDYYSNLQSQNYAAAFGDINTGYQLSSLTETQFAQQASDRYKTYGAILSYTPGQPAYASDPNGGFDFTRFTISVDMKRAKLSYTSILSLRKIGNDWKITNFDSV